MSLQILDDIRSSNLNIQTIAVIMDGNGRWANGYSKPRVWGHHKGASAVRKTIEACRHIGVKFLTLYAFSDENWMRPQYEVDTIMGLLSLPEKEEANQIKITLSFPLLQDIMILPENIGEAAEITIEI